jgi:PhnB protein
MAEVSTYLNFDGNTEEAFEFYKFVFGGEYVGAGISRFGDIPGEEPTPDEIKNLVINVGLRILGGHLLMGTDAIEGMGQTFIRGTDVSICLHPDSKEDADRLFAALSAGGVVEMPMADQFWGDYYGTFTDRFGKNWMINYTPAS